MQRKIILLSFLYEPELGEGSSVVFNQPAQALTQKSNPVVVITSWQGKGIKADFKLVPSTAFISE